MLEKNFWKRLRATLPIGAFCCRIEAGYSTPGTPDVWVCLNGVHAWVELKVARGTRVLLTPQQVIWHRTCAKADGRSWVVVGSKDLIYLWPGTEADGARDRGIATGRIVNDPWDIILRGN